MRLVAGGLLLLSWLAGCASAPVHYYTLSSVPPAGSATPLQLTAPLGLERLTVPTELDRMQLVRRLDSTRVQILDEHRWAAPLDDMMRRVLTEDLALRLGSGAIAEPNEPANGERRASLAVDIREMYGDVDCAVTLHAAWTLKMTPAARTRTPARLAASAPTDGAADAATSKAADAPTGKAAQAQDSRPEQAATRRGDENIHLAAGSCPGPAGLPPQISQALAQLSDRIVSALPH
ncbi:MAG: membrane integrity-associated transporter subunit PqiC [Sinobacteraceae bacterium]|nr:membrane integrity-associated transporter subunit PqiC [Nevskiaceae bacterium]